MLFRAIITHKLPAGPPPIQSSRASRLRSCGSGQGDTHRMTTHPTCCCSDWRRRLPGTPTSLGTWCPRSWCTDHQGQTWEESGESVQECSRNPSPPSRGWAGTVSLSYLVIPKSDTLMTWFSPTRQFRAAWTGGSQQKGKRDCWWIINNEGVPCNQALRFSRCCRRLRGARQTLTELHQRLLEGS